MGSSVAMVGAAATASPQAAWEPPMSPERWTCPGAGPELWQPNPRRRNALSKEKWAKHRGVYGEMT